MVQCEQRAGGPQAGRPGEGADLEKADLSGAKNLTAAQVRSAQNWHEAYLPDSLKYLKDLPEPPARPRPRRACLSLTRTPRRSITP